MRIDVRKTYKLYIGGAFPRSESGRSYVVSAEGGKFLANAAQASRKDARDAVVAARRAFPGWSMITAYNRGQILYRVAELMEGRRAEFVASVMAAEGGRPEVAVEGGRPEVAAEVGRPEVAEAMGSGAAPAAMGSEAAEAIVSAAIDRWVWYAGWTDKIASVLGGSNPVAGPYFDFSVPEPTGVVAVIAPQESSLLGLVSVLAPVMATGCTAVVVASESRPLAAVTLSEVLATSDVPGGVVNVLTGRVAELAPVLAAHMDVNAIDLTGVAPAEAVAALQRAAADNVKRVFLPSSLDWDADPGLGRIRAFVETKTVWHPIGV